MKLDAIQCDSSLTPLCFVLHKVDTLSPEEKASMHDISMATEAMRNITDDVHGIARYREEICLCGI